MLEQLSYFSDTLKMKSLNNNFLVRTTTNGWKVRNHSVRPQFAAAAATERTLRSDRGIPDGAGDAEVDGYSEKLQVEGRAQTDVGESFDDVDGKLLDAKDFIAREFFEEFIDNTNRHEVGIGLLGHCFGLTRRKDLSKEELEKIAYLNSNTYR